MAQSSTSKAGRRQQTLDAALFMGSSDLRSLQSKLSATSSELLRLADTAMFEQLLNATERNQLRKAAGIVSSIKSKVAAAKESKQRVELQRAAELKSKVVEARKLVPQAFPLPVSTAVQCVEVIRCALILNHLQVLQSFFNEDEFASRLLNQTRQAAQRLSPEGYLRDQAKHLVNEIQLAVQEYLVDESDQGSTQACLERLLVRCAETRLGVIEQRSLVLQVWLDVLDSSCSEVPHE